MLEPPSSISAQKFILLASARRHWGNVVSEARADILSNYMKQGGMPAVGADLTVLHLGASACTQRMNVKVHIRTFETRGLLHSLAFLISSNLSYLSLQNSKSI